VPPLGIPAPVDGIHEVERDVSGDEFEGGQSSHVDSITDMMTLTG
jgi:hypothetical protein